MKKASDSIPLLAIPAPVLNIAEQLKTTVRMAYSYQSVVSNGTLTNLLLTIDYWSRSEISVYFNGTPTSAWSWVGTTEKQITFSPAVPIGTTVLVRRATALQAPNTYLALARSLKPKQLTTILRNC